MGNDSSTFQDVGTYSEDDERLVSSFLEPFETGFVSRFSKNFQRQKYSKFEPSSEPVGRIFDSGTPSKKVIGRIMEEITSITEDKRNYSFASEFHQKLYVFSRIHRAICREIVRDQNRTSASAAALHSRIRSDAPPLPTSASIGIKSAVRMFLILIRSAEKNDPDICSDILDLLESILSEIPIVSLIEGPTFSPDIVDGIRPFLEFIRKLIISQEQEPFMRQKAANVLFGISLARGSLLEMLALVHVLLLSDASGHHISLQINDNLNEFLEFGRNVESKQASGDSDGQETENSVNEVKVELDSRDGPQEFTRPDNQIVNMSMNSSIADFEDDDNARIHERRHSLARVGADILSGNRNSNIYRNTRVYTTEEKEKHAFEINMLPLDPIAILKKCYPKVKVDGVHQDLSDGACALVLMCQIDRLSSIYARQPDEDIWNDDPNRLAVLNEPLCIEVKPLTFSLLCSILDVVSQGYFSVEGCPDKTFIRNMYILVATLRILKAHLYQFVRAKLSNKEFGLSVDAIKDIKLRIFKFLETPCAPRGDLNSSISLVSDVVQAEAAQILAEAFEFFYSAVSDQVAYLAELVNEFNKGHAQYSKIPLERSLSFAETILSQPEQNLLELLLSRFSSFNSGSLLLNEVENSKDASVKDSIVSVLHALIKANTYDTVMAIRTSDRSFNKTMTLSVLNNFQKHLLSRSAKYLFSESSKNTESSTKQVLFSILSSYTIAIINACNQIIEVAKEVIGNDPTSETVRRVGEDILSQCIVGKLSRPLIVNLACFSNSGNVKLSLSLVSHVSNYIKVSDQLCSLIRRVCPKDELISVERKRNVESKHPYRSNISYENVITIKDAKMLTIVFDIERCETANSDDYMQIFRKPNQDLPVTDRIWGPNSSPLWPNSPIVIDGDSVAIYFHAGADGNSWGFRVAIIGTVLVEPLKWLENFIQDAGFVLGKMLSSLITGPFSVANDHFSPKWNVLLKGGLSPDSTVYECVSKDYFDLKDDTLEELHHIYTRDKKSNMDKVEEKFLFEIRHYTGKGRSLIDLLKKCVPDTYVVQPSIVEDSNTTVRLILALFLKQTGRVSQALKFLSENSGNEKLRVNEGLVKLWKKALEVKMDMRTYKAQGMASDELLQGVVDRVNFLWRIQRSSENSSHSMELLSPKSSEKVMQVSTYESIALSNSTKALFSEGEPSVDKSAVMTRLLTNTMHALRRLKELMLVRTRIASFCKDPEAMYLSYCMEFVFSFDVDLDKLWKAMILDRSRAVMRIRALNLFEQSFVNLNNPKVISELIRHLSISFRMTSVNIPSDLAEIIYGRPLKVTPNKVEGTYSKFHYTHNLATVGKDILNNVSNSFFSLIQVLMHKKTIDENSLVLFLDLINMEYRVEDLKSVFNVGLVAFLEPLITFIGSNRGILNDEIYCNELVRHGQSRRKPWNVRFCAWALFRVILYSSCQFGSVPDIQGLLNSMLDIIYRQLSILQAMVTYQQNGTIKPKQEYTTSLDESNKSKHTTPPEAGPEEVPTLNFTTWACYNCTFWNDAKPFYCELCNSPKSFSEDQYKKEKDKEDIKGLEFIYESDFDNKGIIYYLGTCGYTESWENPHTRGIIRCSASSLQDDSEPASSIVGLSCVRCVTQPKPNQCFKLQILEYTICPTYYSLKHYSTWDTEALRSWKFEGSKDGIVWVTLREHINDPSLDTKGATHSWKVSANDSYSQFRIFMTDLNSNSHWYCALSGIEIYGTLDADVESSSLSENENLIAGEDYFDNLDTIDMEFSGDNAAKPRSISHTNNSESWHTVKGVQCYKSGKHLIEFLIDMDCGGSNTWKFIIGVVPETFMINSSSTWIGSQGGWGYIGGLGHKNYNSSTNIPYAEPFTTGDVIGMLLDFELGTIEYFKNSKSMGVAFETLKGPVNIAVSMTGYKSKITLLHRESPSYMKKVSADSWQARSQKAHLGNASNIWFEYSLKDIGFRGKPTLLSHPSIGEMNCFTSQLLWVILRCCKWLNVQKILCNEKWIDLLLEQTMSQSAVNQVLALRICRILLPAISPLDDRISNYSFGSVHILDLFWDKSSTSCMDVMSGLIHTDSTCQHIEDLKKESHKQVTGYRSGPDNVSWRTLQGTMQTSGGSMMSISSFATSIGDVCVSRGKWYYEVHLVTAGLKQIGWARIEFHTDNESDGVGDDPYSWSYDGSRKFAWHNGAVSYGTQRNWEAGDVVGCFLDLDEHTISYSLSGVSLGPAFHNIDVGDGLYPAISLRESEECIIFFKENDFKFNSLTFSPLVGNSDKFITESSTSVNFLDADGVSCEYVDMCRILLKSTLWKQVVGDNITRSLKYLPHVITILKDLDVESVYGRSSFENILNSDILKKLRDIFSALAIIGGCLEPIREGSRVRVTADDNSTSDGTVIHISLDSKKSLICKVSLDSSEEVSITNLDQIRVISGVDVPLSFLKLPETILEAIGVFLRSEVPKSFKNFSSLSVLLLNIRRVCLKVTKSFLHVEEFITYFLKRGFGEIIAESALLLCDNLPAGIRNSEENLESRIVCLRKRRSELNNPLVTRTDSTSQVVFCGHSLHSPLIGDKYGVVKFDDYDFLSQLVSDNQFHKQTSILIMHSTRGVFGVQSEYRIDGTLRMTEPHFASDSIESEVLDSLVNLDDSEYINYVSIYFKDDLNMLSLILKSNLGNEYNFGDKSIPEDAYSILEIPKGRGLSAFYGSISNGYFSSFGLVHQEVFVRKLKDFVYVEDLDENGLFYYLGSNFGKEAWKNPSDRGLVEVTVSKVKSDSRDVSAVVGREAVRCLSHDMENGWFVINLKNIRIKPSKYSLRHYSSWDTEALRNWDFEASNDGHNWVTLRQHTNDTSLKRKGQVYTWEIENCPDFFSYFRIYSTGSNSNGHHYVALSGMELYGSANVLYAELTEQGVVEDGDGDETIFGSSKYKVHPECGNLYSFGHGGSGRLGQGSIADVLMPTELASFASNNVVEVSSFNQHVLLLTKAGTVYSWGNGSDGRLGHGDTAVLNSPKVITAFDNNRIIQVRAGNSFSAVLDHNGDIWTFGKGNEGQLGNGGTQESNFPVLVKGVLEEIEIAHIGTGAFHVMAVASKNQALYTWGRNLRGQLGLNSTVKKVLSPEKVTNAPKFVSLCGGWDHSLGLTASGMVYSWGNGYEGSRPAAGHGHLRNTLAPTLIKSIEEKHVVRIASGWDHSMALTREGAVYIWGSNGNGILGDGTNVHSNSPLLLNKGPFGKENVVWIDGGQNHTCCITNKGKLWTWGSFLGVETSVPKPWLDIDNTLIFQSVICGDKSTFLVTTRTLPMVPSSAIVAVGSVDAVLPPYPMKAYLIGHPFYYFKNIALVEDPQAFNVSSGLTPMRLISSTGGHYASQYSIDNLYVDNNLTYSSMENTNIMIVFQPEDLAQDQVFSLNHVIVKNPPLGQFTAPLKTAIVFVTDDISDMSLFQNYNDLDSKTFSNLDNIVDPNLPVVYIDMLKSNGDIRTRRCFHCSRSTTGKYIVVTLLSSVIGATNIDVEFMGFSCKVSSLSDSKKDTLQVTFENVQPLTNLSHGASTGAIIGPIQLGDGIFSGFNTSFKSSLEYSPLYVHKGCTVSVNIKRNLDIMTMELQNEAILIFEACASNLILSCSSDCQYWNLNYYEESCEFIVNPLKLLDWVFLSIVLDYNESSCKISVYLENALVAELLLGESKEMYRFLTQDPEFTLCKNFSGNFKSIAIWPFAFTVDQISFAFNNNMDFVFQDFLSNLNLSEVVDTVSFCSQYLENSFESKIIDYNEDYYYRVIDTDDTDNLEVYLQVLAKEGYVNLRLNSSLKGQSFSSYTLIFDIRIPELFGIQQVFSTSNHDISYCTIQEDGHISLLGMTSSKYKKFQCGVWHRLVITFDRSQKQAFTYIDGQIAASLKNSVLIDQFPDLVVSDLGLFPRTLDDIGNEVNLRNFQIRKFCIHQTDVISLGSAFIPLGDGRKVKNTFQSLLQMGFPLSWCVKANGICGSSRYCAYEWIVTNIAKLEAEDRIEEHHKVALTVSLMGYDIDTCSKVLSLNKNNLFDSIKQLLTLETFSDKPLEYQDIEARFKNGVYAEKANSRNEAFRVLSNVNESMAIEYDIQITRGPLKRVIDFVDLSDIGFNELDDIQERTERILSTVYARSCILAIMENWPEAMEPTLKWFGGEDFFLRFLKLVDFSQHMNGISIIRNFVKKLLHVEKLGLERSPRVECGPVFQNAPLCNALLTEVLTQMIQLIFEPSKASDSESVAMKHYSPFLIIWILSLFGEMIKEENLSDLGHSFFSIQVVNLIFEVVFVSHRDQQLSFIRLLSDLIKSGITFSVERSEVLKHLMNQMHVAQTQSGIYSTFFQALVELNLSLENANTKESLNDAESKSEYIQDVKFPSSEEAPGIQFIYLHDFDSNGILYYLGSAKNTTSWTNPAESGIVEVTSSSLMNDSSPVSAVVGRDSVRCVSQPIPNQWFMIDLLEHSVVPSHYTLKHYISWDTEALRNWKFEGSNDGITWTTIREHINDAALCKKGQSFTWELFDVEDSYSKFRVYMTGLNSNQHWYTALSGFELYGTLDADVLSWEEHEVEFTFEDNLDTNGIVYYLGTRCGTCPWSNPGEAGVVNVEASSLQHNSEPVTCLTGRSAVRCVSQPNPNQWFSIDFLDHRVVPRMYSLRHYSSYDTEAIRNWKFEASNDGSNWTCLKEHVNDSSLHKKGQMFTWELVDVVESYSKFRIYVTGKNSNDHYYLSLSGFEIYGTLITRTGKKTKKSSCQNKYKSWFENILHLFNVSYCLRNNKPLPDSFLKKVWKYVARWSSEKEYMKLNDMSEYEHFVDFTLLNSEFVFSQDEQIVELVNKQCSKRDMDLWKIKAFQWNPIPDDLIHYELIENVSIRALRLRFFLLQQLNTKISSMLPYIDFSLPEGKSILADNIRGIRSIIFWKTKEILWTRALSSTVCSPLDIELTLDRFKAKVLKERKKTDYKGKKSIFGQGFQQLNHRDPKMFRLDRGKQAWKTLFTGEYSDDYGGPYRNSLDDMCAELQSSVLPLFIKCPNGREDIGNNRDKYVPVPSSIDPHHIKMFEFLGKLMGLAMRTKNLLDLDLPAIVLKPLVGQPVTVNEVLDIDLLSFKILDELNKFEKDESVTEELFEDYVNSKFVVMGCDQKLKPLIPDGENIPITWENRKQFSNALIQFKINEFKPHCEAIKRGLATVVPFSLLSLLTYNELEMQICGLPKMNLELLEKMTVYDGCSRQDPHIVMFWSMMKDMFDDAERCIFLKFVWGRSRLPLQADEFDRKFKICRMHKADENPDQYLPISHTCFFSIDLPKYSTLDIMHQKVLYAITHCVAIDADDTTNAQRAARRNNDMDEMSSDEDY